jgi:hypothetical protein
LRDLSPELGGSGSLKVQGDEAARLLNYAMNDNGRGTCATVHGGFLFSVFSSRKHRRRLENAKACFQLEAVSLSRNFFPESWENPQPQKLPTARQQRSHLPRP